MSKFCKIAVVTILVALVGVAILGGVVLAQEPTPTPTPNATPTTPPNLFGLFGRGRGICWTGDYFEQMRDAVASKLGVERADLDAVVQETRQEVIEQAVADGRVTQEHADRMLSPEAGDFGPGMMGFGRGKRSPLGNWMGSGKEVLAEQLDLTADELATELKAGKTIAELAEEQGIDLQTMRDAMSAAQVEAMKANIQQAVEEERMTQDQADWVLKGLEQGFLPRGRSFGHGRAGRFPHLCSRTTP